MIGIIKIVIIIGMDVFYTIENEGYCELKVKGSRFIASAFNVDSKDNALEKLKLIRDKFYDATHHCFAYNIGSDGLEFRTSDDGEPSGSGGKPILFTIKKFELSNIIVIVTRYFGGTKLGVGGLARAYSQASNDILKLCKKVPVYITQSVKVFCTYVDLSAVKGLISEYAVRFNEEYSDVVHIVCEIPKSKVAEFCDRLNSNTKGRAGALINN